VLVRVVVRGLAEEVTQQGFLVLGALDPLAPGIVERLLGDGAQGTLDVAAELLDAALLPDQRVLVFFDDVEERQVVTRDGDEGVHRPAPLRLVGIQGSALGRGEPQVPDRHVDLQVSTVIGGWSGKVAMLFSEGSVPASGRSHTLFSWHGVC